MKNKKVLVLNASYEPLSTCNLKRAICLMYLGKADLVKPFDGLIVRSEKLQFPMPSVVRLISFVKVPFRPIPLSKKNIFKRDQFTCQYCGSQSGPFTIDHVIPKSKNGKDDWTNMVCACVRCNNLKGQNTLKEVNMKLLRTPKEPHPLSFLYFHLPNIHFAWKPYLYMD